MSRTAYHQLSRFLASDAATACFARVQWRGRHRLGQGYQVEAYVQYGPIEDLALDIRLYRDDTWYMQLCLPPVLPRLEADVATLCDAVNARQDALTFAPYQGYIFVEATGAWDNASFAAAWAAFGLDCVQDAILYILGATALDAEDIDEDASCADVDIVPDLDLAVYQIGYYKENQ